MDDKMTDADFAAKISWEGGVYDALEYGLSSDELLDPTSNLGLAWAELEAAYESFRLVVAGVERVLDDYPEYS